MGNYKKSSDIDVAISGEKVNLDTVAKLYGILNNEVAISCFVDVVDLNRIETEKLRQHIQKNGKK